MSVWGKILADFLPCNDTFFMRFFKCKSQIYEQLSHEQPTVPQIMFVEWELVIYRSNSRHFILSILRSCKPFVKWGSAPFDVTRGPIKLWQFQGETGQNKTRIKINQRETTSCSTMSPCFKTLRLRQYGQHFIGNILFFLNQNCSISI